MAEIASAFVTLAPSAKGFGSKLDSEIGGDIDSSGKRAGGTFGKVFAVGAAAAIGGALLIGKFLKDSIGEAREAQKVGALTESIIKSTGGAANVTAAQVGKLAGAISLKTGVDDEAIQSGANLLLTFKNVANEAGKGNDVFDRATKAAVDLSAAGFGALTGTSKQLGKALNDPIAGISALSRSGVTFTEQQKEQIKTLVESGNTLKAQKIILAEVESQVGGAAAASATYGEKASVAFGNIKEQVGTALLPVIDGFFKLFLSAVPTVTNLINGIGPAFASVGAFFAPVVAQVQAFLGGSGGGIIASVQSFAASVQANFLPVLQAMKDTFIGEVLPAVTSVAQYVATKLSPIFTQAGDIITGQVLPIVGKLATFFYDTLYPAIIRIVTAVATNLKPVFDQLVGTFRSSVLPTVEALLVKFEEYRPTIQKVIAAVVAVIGKVVEFAAVIIAEVLPPLIRFAGYLISNVVPAIADVIGVVIRIIGKVVDFAGALADGVLAAGEFLTGVRENIASALALVTGIPGKVTGVFTGAATLLYDAGSQLMSGLAAGIQAKIDAAVQAVKDGLAKIKDLLPGSPIKSGPLKSWNNGGAGKRLVGLLADGLGDTSSVDAAMQKLTSRIAVGAPDLSGALDFGRGDPRGRGGRGSGAIYQFYTFDLVSAVREAQRREAFMGMF